MTGLLPDTLYHFRIVTAPADTPVHTVRTAPSRTVATGTSAGFSFVAYGDSRSHPERHGAVIQSILAAARPLFVVHTGDLVAAGEDSARWHQEFLLPGAALFRSTPILAVLGNHDLDGRSRPQDLSPWWRRVLVFPGQQEAAGYGRWFSLDIGGIHLVCLDSTAPDADGQTEWLSADLASPAAQQADFIVAVYHHPSYTAGNHRSDMHTRAKWTPLFDRYGMDLVLNGHNHFYQRTFPIRYGIPQKPAATEGDPGSGSVYRAGEGTVYCVTGGGGAPLYEPDTAHFVATGARRYHFL
ncbi:MAG: metallophosphoesterase, partial [bacterium]